MEDEGTIRPIPNRSDRRCGTHGANALAVFSRAALLYTNPDPRPPWLLRLITSGIRGDWKVTQHSFSMGSLNVDGDI